jgi:hypothetical protein
MLLLPLIASLAFGAACPKTGTTYTCPDGGSDSANRTYLVDTMTAADCGETIVLPAGVIYKPQVTSTATKIYSGNPITIPVRSTTACNAADKRYITIQSSRAGELPEGVRVTGGDGAPSGDELKMAIVYGTHSGFALKFAAGAKRWKFVGILFTTDPALNGCDTTTTTVCTMTNYLIGPPDASYDVREIVMDRCVCRNYDTSTQFSQSLGCFQMEGFDFTIKNSWFDFRGWNMSLGASVQDYHSVTGITNGASPVFTLSPGTSSLTTGTAGYRYEFSNFTGDYAVLNGYRLSAPTPNTTLTDASVNFLYARVESGSDPKTIRWVSEAPHGLSTGTPITLNVTQPSLSSCLHDATPSITVVNSYQISFTASGCTAGFYYLDGSEQFTARINTTGFTGTLGNVRLTLQGNINPLLSVGGPGPFRIENNYIAGQFTGMFLGGGSNGAQINPAHLATITATSDNAHFTLSHVNGLRVGDGISLVNSSNAVCQGRVTAISGNDIVVTGAGTFRPTSGCTFTTSKNASWRGYPIQGALIKGNTFFQDQAFRMAAHKGYFEIKTATDVLFIGNKFLGEEDKVHAFITVRNDAITPQGIWATGERITYQSNLSHSGGTTFNLRENQDGIATQRAIALLNPADIRYTNNLHFASFVVPLNDVQSGDADMRHNSWIMPPTMLRGKITAPGPRLIVSSTICGASPQGFRPFQWIDNIVNYGLYGFSGAADCWDLTKTSNVFVDNFSQSISEPGNQVASNVAALGLAGTCDYAGENWKNCYLGGGSTYKGDASDGKDPGVDMEELVCEVDGHCGKTGLYLYDAYTKRTLNPAAWKIGSTRVSITANKINGGTCTFILYTNAARTTQHGDTDTAPEQDCARTGNASTAGTVTLVLGTNTALTASTTYYYKLTMGSAVIVGEFATVASGSGIAASWNRARECGSDGSTFGTAVPASTPSSPNIYSIASGNVRYCRAAVGEPVEVLVAP